jgi:Amt family ammonium transporter
VTALVLGKRIGYRKEPMLPHNVPFIVLGAGLLWFGWFGFNAGSALAANGLAASAFVATNTAAAAAGLAWVCTEWIHNGKPTLFGAASGCVAGLVAITPASGFVTPMSAIVIGLVGGAICYYAVSVMKAKLGYDDALDTFGVHGIGGTWGALATGLFASTAVNANGHNGLFYGAPGQLGVQLIGVLATWVFAAAMTFIILKVVSLFTGLRASAAEEIAGLDLPMHGERAYDYIS